MSKDPIDFYFEFGSPYGYFAAFEVAKIEADTGRSVRWHPFMLGPAFKKTEQKPLLQIPLKGPYCVHDWERLSLITGTPWVMPEKFPVGILAAPRAFYWINDNDPELAKTYALAIYKAYFGDGRPVWEEGECADIAAECGIDRTEFLDVVQREEVKQRFKDITSTVIDDGVFGSPFFKVDGEPFWGFDRIDMMKQYIAQGCTWVQENKR